MNNENQKFSTQTWVSASLILVIVALGSKGIGFVRDLLIAKYFGVSAQVDAFVIVTSLTLLIGGGVGFALSTALVPLYQRTLYRDGAIRANGLAWTVVIFGTLISILFMFPLYVMPLSFIKLVGPSLPGSTARLAAGLTRWLSLYVLGLNLVYILTAYYHAFHHFKIPAYSDLAFNIMTILILLTFSLSLGIYALVFGNILGIFLCVAILFAFLLKKKLPGFGFSFQNPEVKSLFIFAVPILFLDFTSQISSVIENYFASGLPEGSISALNYGKKLTTTVTALVAINVARGMFPTLSMLYSEHKRAEARDLFVKLNKQLILLFVPLSVLLIILHKEILRLLFMRGAFDESALEKTSVVFLFYASTFLMTAIEPVFLRACYAFSDTKTPLVSTVLSVIFIIPMNYLFTPVMGIAGIALTTNLSFMFRVIIQAFFLRKKLGGLALVEMFKTIFIALLCALVAISPILVSQKKQFLDLLISIGLFFVFYFGIGWLLMNNEMRNTWKLLRQHICILRA